MENELAPPAARSLAPLLRGEGGVRGAPTRELNREVSAVPGPSPARRSSRFAGRPLPAQTGRGERSAGASAPVRVALQLALGGEVHVAGVEAQLHVACVAEHALAAGSSMPTASADFAPSPSRPLLEQELAHAVHGRADSAALLVKARRRRPALSNILVVASWLSKPARSVPEAFAIASLAALPSSPCRGHHAPWSRTRRRPAPCRSSGLSFSVAVLTTIRSMISPGICEESNTFVGVGRASRISETMRVPGHHRGDVRRLEGGDHVGVGGVDDLDVLLGQPIALERARQQVVRHRELDEVDLLALDRRRARSCPSGSRASLPLEKSPTITRGGVDAAGGGDRQRVHVGHGHSRRRRRRCTG